MDTPSLLPRLALALLAALPRPGAAQAAGETPEPRPLVVATNTILADMAAEVAGPDAEVHCLVPRGVDLHGYEPRPSDVAQLARASLVVANGAGFEPWIERLVANSGFSGTIVHASRGCPLLEWGGEAHAHGHDESCGASGHGTVDPHAWQDLANGIRYVEAIRAGLAAADPARAAAYAERARAYTERLGALDAAIRARFEAIPPERRRILTSHEALAYFGRAYGLEIVPLRGLDLMREPDARRLAALVDELRARRIRAIFVEAVSNPKMLEQLARDTGTALGGELFTDSVGAPGTPAATYLGMLRENADRIARALAAE